MDVRSKIIPEKLPQHIAIIMDGNGRWAKSHGKNRIFGHRNGVKTVREITETAAELGIKYLTLYTFSMENWNRPETEVNFLMSLLIETVRSEVNTLHKNNIRLQAIGDIAQLPPKTHKALLDGIEKTKGNTRMTLLLALNYSAKWEIMRAVRNLAEKSANGSISAAEIDEQAFEAELSTAGIPNPELLIRTSGEHRLSNFMLWQLAYAEFYFTDVFWPAFTKEHFFEAILDYQNRERRFGMISEQLT